MEAPDPGFGFNLRSLPPNPLPLPSVFSNLLCDRLELASPDADEPGGAAQFCSLAEFSPSSPASLASSASGKLQAPLVLLRRGGIVEATWSVDISTSVGEERCVEPSTDLGDEGHEQLLCNPFEAAFRIC